ncbi:NlpC/P60 family protein [Thorsellia anophelis DSM 18579]|uniref:NlpC/P60 family protein n=1 Tax=Thorsellia anophelis DSM 18579 TaxID=1123402 RepID=A0A1H9ZV33_9GAMM|nr:NlpC/P60 family protein [Thorsellia anophelis DSM 18579]
MATLRSSTLSSEKNLSDTKSSKFNLIQSLKTRHVKKIYELHKSNICKMTSMLLISTLLVACNSKPTIDSQALAQSLKSSQAEFEKMVNSLDTREKIMNQYATWKGVRYRLGGSSKKGIDCSGFVQLTFKEQFGVTLPRSTREQQKIGEKIAKTALIHGDIVVFNAGSTGRHVGIYIGNDKFVHASTSIGVTISDMNDRYWKNRFNEARRVLKPTSIAALSSDKQNKKSVNENLFKESNSKQTTNKSKNKNS